MEPLRNMPIISDLAVDMGQFFRKFDEVDYNQVQPVTNQPEEKGIQPINKYCRILAWKALLIVLNVDCASAHAPPAQPHWSILVRRH